MPVVPGVERKPVVLKARCAQSDRVLVVVQLKARCAGVIPDARGTDEGRLCRRDPVPA